MRAALERAQTFCAQFGLRVPILLAPMAGVPAPSLSVAVASAGGMGACGVLLMKPEEIISWANQVRAGSNGAFQLNNWIPDPPPERDAAHEETSSSIGTCTGGAARTNGRGSSTLTAAEEVDGEA